MNIPKFDMVKIMNAKEIIKTPSNKKEMIRFIQQFNTEVFSNIFELYDFFYEHDNSNNRDTEEPMDLFVEIYTEIPEPIKNSTAFRDIKNSSVILSQIIELSNDEYPLVYFIECIAPDYNSIIYLPIICSPDIMASKINMATVSNIITTLTIYGQSVIGLCNSLATTISEINGGKLV